MLDFLKALFGRVVTWLQAIGVGVVTAILAYLQTAGPATGDPIDSMITGAILAGLVKLVGALVKVLAPKLLPSVPA